MTVDRTDPRAGALRWPVLLVTLGALALVVALGLWIGGRVAAGTSAGPEGTAASTGTDGSAAGATATTDASTTPTDRATATTDARVQHISAVAGEDADTLAAALAEVDAAAAELDRAVAIARAHHEQVAIPVRDLVVAHSEEFSQEVADVLQAVVELSVEAVRAHGEGDAEPTEPSQLPEALAHLSSVTSDHTAALEAYYRPLSEDGLIDARADVTGEVARLASLAQEHRDATSTIKAGLQSVDETVYAVLSVAQDTGAATAQTLTHSSEEASEALALAIDDIAGFTAVAVPDSTWEQRTLERPSVLVDPPGATEVAGVAPVVEVVETYLVTARDARSSHALHLASAPSS